MPQDAGMGLVIVREDFQGAHAQTFSDATEYRWNDIRIAAISGDVVATIEADEPNGVMSFSGAGSAADGVAFYSMPMQPSTQGRCTMGARVDLPPSIAASVGGYVVVMALMDHRHRRCSVLRARTGALDGARVPVHTDRAVPGERQERSVASSVRAAVAAENMRGGETVRWRAAPWRQRRDRSWHC